MSPVRRTAEPVLEAAGRTGGAGRGRPQCHRSPTAPIRKSRPTSTTTTTTHEVHAMTRQTTSSSVYRPVPPPPTRRELRRAAAVQAAWLAELR